MGNLVRACPKILKIQKGLEMYLHEWDLKHKALGSGLCIDGKKENQKNETKTRMKFTQRRGVSLLKSKGTMAPLNTSCFSSSWGRWKPAESWRGRPEEGLRKAPQSASLTRLSRWMERTSLIIYTLLMKRVTLNLLQTRYTHETLVQGKGN